jgi:uncharacterized membrane protein
MNRWLDRIHGILPSRLGLVLGALAFTASLWPSLIPRPSLAQGLVGGLAFAAGYGAGAALAAVWRWLAAATRLSQTGRDGLWTLAAVAGLAFALFGLSQATHWQNMVRAAVGADAVETGRPLIIAAVALLVAGLLVILGWWFVRLMRLTERGLGRLLPARIALFLGLAVTAGVFWMAGDGILLRAAVAALDNTYRRVDRFIPPEQAAPADPAKTGSAASLMDWAGLGAEGRNRVVSAPTRADIEALSGGPALEPLRVYVGLNSADDVDERARLALEELKRIGAFDRKLLVIATPTGTGWIDPAGMAPVEILARGDIASVSVQYSYLPSWLSLMVEFDYGNQTSRAVFREVYGHWRTLPKGSRPALYLFGLSLGSLNSDLSADMFDIVSDPYQGALWVGPPFASRTWNWVTAGRAKDSPAWLPVFRDSSLFRFMNQTDAPVVPGAAWGAIRIVYLQYASDPIVFFQQSSFWRKPDWLTGSRGPDVAPDLDWVPGVTFLQLALDMMIATTVEKGTGHVYAAEDYLRGWLEVAPPEGWSAEAIDGVRVWMDAQGW